MLTGNPIIDALGTGAVSAVGGWFANKILRRKTKREFYRCGGITYDEAMETANALGQSGGLKISGPVIHKKELCGRKLCESCLKDFPVTSTFEDCPHCGDELFVDQYFFDSYTIDLIRDVPA